MKIVIGSRQSVLARWQAAWVKDRLEAAGYEIEIRFIKTSGDKSPSASLTQSGVKGLFIKEIEEALAFGRVDVAVHSLKDLPIEQPESLYVVAVPPREDPRDVFISKGNRPFMALPPGSRVGTSSLRRQGQMRLLRADLQVIPLRGNLDTRLRKLDQGECDALVLAAAGLRRLGLDRRITEYFAIHQMCPAVGQGALAIEIRQGDRRIEGATKPLDHAASHCAVRAERALLRDLGGGCQVPIAAHACADGTQLRLVGVVPSLSDSRVLQAEAAGSMADPESLGATVARHLLGQGARELLKSVL